MSNDPTQKTPGELVREAMEAKVWTQSDLAFAIGTTAAAINQILSDKRAVSQNMARALGVALDLPAEVLARAQADWDVRHADKPDPSVSARARILSKYPLREMVRRGWIDPDRRDGSLENQVCKFFGVRSLDDVPHLSHSAKKSDYSNIPPSQLVWLFRVRQIAAEMHPASYNPMKLQQAIEAFKDMREEPEAVRHVPRLLEQAGVRFVVVEGLPGGQIDGVCFWLAPDAPVIGMSLRFDRIDNFWFVLRHECSHVLHGHGKQEAIVDIDLERASEAINDEERTANEEASDFCVPSEKISSFYLRKKPFFSDIDVVSFSKRVKVHPGLTVGQLQRMTSRYDLLRKHLVKVRSYLSRSMMMDGWGDVVPVET